MNKINLTIFLFMSLLTNCKKDDDSLENKAITGIWNLENVWGGFEGVDINYEKGVVTWEFVPESNNLIVVSSIINNGPQSLYSPLQSGIYNYTLTESNGKTFIKIEIFEIFDNGEYGRYQINSNGELWIDQGEGSESNAVDVFTLLFDK